MYSLAFADYIAFLGLGSNLGDREEELRRAADALRGTGVVLQQSELYYTMPVDFESDNSFVNQVIAIATPLDPHELLNATQAIESAMGRTQKSHNGIHHDRTIDIDLLRIIRRPAHGEPQEITVSTPDLTIPHPKIGQRPFVSLPLSEITESI